MFARLSVRNRFECGRKRIDLAVSVLRIPWNELVFDCPDVSDHTAS
jgi:hypothetical protein